MLVVPTVKVPEIVVSPVTVVLPAAKVPFTVVPAFKVIEFPVLLPVTGIKPVPLIVVAAKAGTETLNAAARAESLKAVLIFINISVSYKKTGLP